MRKTIYVLILSLMPTLAMAREQNSSVKLVNLSGWHILSTTVGHKYGDDRYAAKLSTKDIPDKRSKNIGQVSSEVGIGRMSANWWKVAFVRSNGAYISSCVTHPRNFRGIIDNLETAMRLGGDQLIAMTAAAGVGYATGGNAAAAATAYNAAQAISDKIIGEVTNTSSTVGYKQHTIPNGVREVRIEIGKNEVRFLDMVNGKATDKSTTTLSCSVPFTKGISLTQGKPIPKNGKFGQIVNHKSNKCMVVYNASTKAGTPIVQWEGCQNQGNTNWTFREKSKDWFEIVNQKSKQCLNVAGGSKANGAKVVQWTCDGGANSLWTFVWGAGKMNFYLKNKKSSKCLVVDNASTKNGAELVQWDCNKTPNSTWRIK